MLRRGQRIIITESSAKGRTHPAKGDVGYLNNIYLFYKDRFILIDAYFFTFKSNIKKRTNRCEKKKFIIDLGMASSLRRKIQAVGLRRSWLNGNRYFINLASAAYQIAPGGIIEFPSINGPYGPLPSLFPSGYSSKDRPIKIPLGQIANMTGRYTLECRSCHEIECWARCIYPLIDAHVLHFLTPNCDSHSISFLIREIYTILRCVLKGEDLGGYLRFDGANPRDWGLRDVRRTVIEKLKEIQTLSEMYVINLDNKLKRTIKFGEAVALQSAWQKTGVLALVDSQQLAKLVVPATVEATVSALFRTILTSNNIERGLRRMKSVIPWPGDTIKDRSAQFENIRRAAVSGSAALARIYEDNLLD